MAAHAGMHEGVKPIALVARVITPWLARAVMMTAVMMTAVMMTAVMMTAVKVKITSMMAAVTPSTAPSAATICRYWDHQ